MLLEPSFPSYRTTVLESQCIYTNFMVFVSEFWRMVNMGGRLMEENEEKIYGYCLSYYK